MFNDDILLEKTVYKTKDLKGYNGRINGIKQYVTSFKDIPEWLSVEFGSRAPLYQTQNPWLDPLAQV